MSDIKVVGTMNDVCFYHMDGAYYARQKPGPERKVFLKHKRYAPQREASLRMNKGNKVASLIYNAIAKDKRVYRINCELQKKAALLFKGGHSVEEVTRALCAWMVGEGYMSKEEALLLPAKAGGLDFRDCVPGSGRRKDVDHFQGVKLRTAGGRWIRIYHLDEWELLDQFEEQIEQGDAWVEAFLEQRKKLPTYRLKHQYKRRRKMMSNPGSEEVVREGLQGQEKVEGLPSLVKYPSTGKSAKRRTAGVRRDNRKGSNRSDHRFEIKNHPLRDEGMRRYVLVDSS